MPQEESLFLQWVDTLCGNALLHWKGAVPGPWEEEIPGWMRLGDVGESVVEEKNEWGDWGCFGVMQVGLGSASGCQVAHWLNLRHFLG